jgi:hypothetical protein
MRERREAPDVERSEGCVRKMSLEVSELLEAEQCSFFPHFEFECADG